MLNRLSIKQFSLNRYLLIVDLNNVLHKAIAVNPYLKARYKGHKIYTGGIYGALKQINSVIEKFMIDEMIVCNDCPPYIRTSMYKGYKSNRSGKTSEIGDNLADSKYLLSRFFKKLNICTWKLKGYEADDLIAAICHKYENTYSKIIILSNDKDLYQLLSSQKVFLAGKEGGYGKKDFIADFQIENPKLWKYVSVLSGGHNGLPGIEGIGQKKAIDIFRKGKKFI